MGDEALARGHNISAAESYLRASTYFRAAEFYLHGNPQDPRIPYLWGESRDLFVQSLQLSGVDFERVSIAYEGTTLPGYFYKVDEGGGRPGRPSSCIPASTVPRRNCTPMPWQR